MLSACLNLSSLPARDACLAAFATPDMHLAIYATGVAILAGLAKLAADYFL